ncbi:MAG: hypothetical protein H7Z77_00210 [Chitinophagaceae bacterium]|nr:hypothetical protein [Polaromonas sp.]
MSLHTLAKSLCGAITCNNLGDGGQLETRLKHQPASPKISQLKVSEKVI